MGEDYDEKAILYAEYVSHWEELLGAVIDMERLVESKGGKED